MIYQNCMYFYALMSGKKKKYSHFHIVFQHTNGKMLYGYYTLSFLRQNTHGMEVVTYTSPQEVPLPAQYVENIHYVYNKS